MSHDLDRGPNPMWKGGLSRRPEDQLGQAGVRRRMARWGRILLLLALLGVLGWYLSPLVQP